MKLLGASLLCLGLMMEVVLPCMLTTHLASWLVSRALKGRTLTATFTEAPAMASDTPALLSWRPGSRPGGLYQFSLPLALVGGAPSYYWDLATPAGALGDTLVVGEELLGGTCGSRDLSGVPRLEGHGQGGIVQNVMDSCPSGVAECNVNPRARTVIFLFLITRKCTERSDRGEREKEAGQRAIQRGAHGQRREGGGKRETRGRESQTPRK